MKQTNKITSNQAENKIYRFDYPPTVIWITGLSGSGKTTLANKIYEFLTNNGSKAYLLDGDKIRTGLNSDLGFTETDRRENLRRSAYVAQLLTELGYIVICSFISPRELDRALVKEIIGLEKYSEIFLDVSIDICKKRDPKGLYKMAIEGKITNFTGISQEYQKPLKPNFTFYDNFDLDDAVRKVFEFYQNK